MSKIEQRTYVVDGSLTAEQWHDIGQKLGELGLNVTQARQSPAEVLEAMAPIPAELRQPLPYTLEDVTSRNQFVAEEHAEEFWKSYAPAARKRGENPEKRACVYYGLSRLLHPAPRGYNHQLQLQHSDDYARKLGLKLVRPRSSVGFPMIERRYLFPSDTVIQAGNFIDFMGKLVHWPREKRPAGINKEQIRFLSALALKIDDQISNSTQNI